MGISNNKRVISNNLFLKKSYSKKLDSTKYSIT